MMKKYIILLLALVAATSANAQNAAEAPNIEPKRAWEFGIGGSVYQFNRVPYIKFTPGENLNTVDIKLRNVVYTGNIYAAKELSNVFALDFQGGLGMIEENWLAHAGLGLQWRLGHYLNSPYIDPYLRIGAGYMYKGYNISYSGETDGVKYQWWNVDNKDGADKNSVIPISAGAGINMWMNDRFGIGISGDYVYIPENRVSNPLQGTVRLLFRVGGKSKKSQPVVTYVDKPVEKIVEVERVVERPVVTERVVERVVNISELLSNIYFDFDKSDIKPEYNGILDMIKDFLLQNTNNRYLLSGFTDARGSAEYNQSLSERRVNAIRDALLSRGVPAAMLKTRGQGMKISNMPASAGEQARMGDRKVVIEQISNQEYWDQL
jgi:outer membrane protein OmpA-like peptidoglycan-associated protein